MPTDGIASAFRDGRDRVAGRTGVRDLLNTMSDRRTAAPSLYRTTGADWLADAHLGEGVFGPLGLFVTVADAEETRAVAASLQGQVTCTLHMDGGDAELARTLLPILVRKAGRVLANGFPTGGGGR